jgi:hypothetical protein
VVIPPVPVMVIVEFPVGAFEAVVMVIADVPEPGAPMDDGPKPNWERTWTRSRSA